MHLAMRKFFLYKIRDSLFHTVTMMEFFRGWILGMSLAPGYIWPFQFQTSNTGELLAEMSSVHE